MMAQYFKGNNEPQFLKNNFWMGGFSRSDINRLVPGMDSDEFSLGFIESKVDDLKRECASLDRMNQILYMDFHMYLQNDILFKVDHANMCHGVEARVPFLDHVLIEKVFSYPYSLFMRGGQNKHILRETMQGYMPKGVLSRQSKSGRPGNNSYLVYNTLNEEMTRLIEYRVAHANGFWNKDISRLYSVDTKTNNIARAESWFRFYLLEKWLHLNNFSS